MTEAPDTPAPAKRAGRKIPFRTLAIALAVPAIGIVALVALRDPEPSASRYSVTETVPIEADRHRDPLAAELARCRTIAADSVDDRCHAAWEDHRRRFYGERRRALPTEFGEPAAPSAAEER